MTYRNDALTSKQSFLDNRIRVRIRSQVEHEIFDKWMNNQAIIELYPVFGDDEPDFLGAVSQIVADLEGKGFTVNNQYSGVHVLLTIS